MKAYPNCPECHTDNSAKWLQEVTGKPYVTCMCIECNKIYNQIIEVQDKECMVIKPDHIKPVQVLNEQGLFIGFDFPYNHELPVETVKHSTSQARLELSIRTSPGLRLLGPHRYARTDLTGKVPFFF